MSLSLSNVFLGAVCLMLLVATTLTDAYELKCPNMRGDTGGRYYDEDLYEHDRYFGDGGKYRLPAECKSASDNTRGKYSTALKPCTFSFHKSTDKDDGSSFRASTVCTDKNKINKDTIQEYVKGWPDECVGFFSRCYSVQRDESIFLNFFCKTKPEWKIPQETTHISVSCIDDAQAKIIANQNRTGYDSSWETKQEEQFLTRIEKEEAHWQHLEIVALISFFLTFFACLIIVKCVYSNLLSPYYQKLATHEE